MSTAITRQGGGWAIAPANMGELFSFAKMLADSDLVPKDYRDKPGNCMVAIQMGGELGLSPMQSIQNIAVINGRPSLWGDALLAVCLPHLDAFDEADDGQTATCTAKRGNRTVTTTFSMEDAKRAGLAGKAGPWSQYPARMRKARARGFTLRDICADVLRGIQSAEEAEDIPREVRAEVVEPKPAAAPPKAAEPKTLPPPRFALSFPIKEWADKPMADAPVEALADYIAWLEGVLGDRSRSRLHKKAAESKSEAEALYNARVEAEMDKAQAKPESDPINDELDKLRGAEPGTENDTNESWGLSPQ